MWQSLRELLGEASDNEIAMAAMLFLCILLSKWAPVAGQAIGGLFDDGGAESSPSDSGKG